MWPFSKKSKKPLAVVGCTPSGRVVSVFVPKETFHSDEMGSTYVKDFRYYLREGNDKLEVQVEAWASEGKVKRM